jgi:hypothetical protein
MTSDRFDRTVAEWLHDDAEHHLPDHLADVLARTSRTPQRRWWSSPERWLPMPSLSGFESVPRVAWLLVIVALLAALGVAVLIGGSQPRLPAPFGLARNGVVAYGAGDGDIYGVDPLTASSTPLITGAQRDVAPFYSRDGARFAFLRGASDHLLTAFVAQADGTGVHAVTPVLTDQVWWDWSYDETRLAMISTVDGIKKITIANTDGSGSRTLDVGMPADFVSWRGPDDSELVFRGYPDNSSHAGIFAVRPDGKGLRRVSPTLGDQVGGYQDPQTAQDGTRVAYTAFELDSASGVMLLRLHVLDLTSGRDIVIPGAPDPIDPTLPTDEGYGVFSADGRQIAFWRDSSDNKIVVAVAPSDGSSPGHSIGPANLKVDGKDVNFDFSPDASMLVVRYPNEAVVHLLPLDGSPGTTLPLDAGDLPSWQRRAP